MCPHGYHHSGSMATPALGTRDVRFIYTYKTQKAPQNKQTKNKQLFTADRLYLQLQRTRDT